MGNWTITSRRMWQPTDVKMDQNKEIKSGGSGELQSAVYTFCCGGMMKYWNIELDILHGQQAFISTKSVPCVTRPALVLSRGVTETRERRVRSTWWALFKVSFFFPHQVAANFVHCAENSCSLTDLYPHSDSTHFQKWQHFSSCFIQSLDPTHTIFLLLHLTFPFHVQKQPPNGHCKLVYCASLNVPAYTCPPPCPHLVPLGLNMIMVIVNLFAEEAFAANGA